MSRSTAIVLAVVAVLTGIVLLVRPAPRVDSAPVFRSELSAIAAPTLQEVPEVRPSEPAATPAATAPPVALDSPKLGTLHGTVRVNNPRRPKRPLKLDADPRCAALHPAPVWPETLVVDADDHVRWAFVSVKAGLKGRRFVPPLGPATLTQEGCRYAPHVLGVQAGQPLAIINQDPMLHNIQALPFANQGFNFGQSMQGQVETKTFKTPEIVHVKCDVHPWMSAWVAVTDHPYYAVTNEAGLYVLSELPTGRYTIEVWQESCEAVVRDVEVLAAGDSVLDFLLDVRK